MGTNTPFSLKHRSGPEPTDVALRTRNRLWAWVVYACTSEVTSWDALDAYWLRKIDGGTPTEGGATEQRGRRRAFHRYFHTGNDPGKLRGLNGRKLIDVVHADLRQHVAKALYRSPLWELTASEAPPLDRVREIHADLLKRLGLVCLTPTERVVARVSGFSNVASDNRDLRNIAESAYNVGALASIDAIALLGCSFRLALENLSLGEASTYLEALRWSVKRFMARWHAHGIAGKAIATLVEVRLLRRPVTPTPAELFGFRKRKDRRMCASSAEPEELGPHSSLLANGEASYASPIVPMDGEMQDFLLNFEENCLSLREHIIQRISSQVEATDVGLPQDANAIHQKRADLIDGVLLGALNSHDEAATEMLRFCARYQALGGLPRILDELFNSDVEQSGFR